LRGDLPVTPVRDIQIHPRDNDILLATHGRGLYILDDRDCVAESWRRATADATLFDIRPAVRWSQWNRDGNLGQKKWTGENPPAGALITYFLKTQPPGEVNITISDNAGRVIRRLRRVADDAGLNRVAWDLRPDPPPGLALEAGAVDAAVVEVHPAQRLRSRIRRSQQSVHAALPRRQCPSPISRRMKAAVVEEDAAVAVCSRCCRARTRSHCRSTGSSSRRPCRSSWIRART
jgi:hypothetical protein